MNQPATSLDRLHDLALPPEVPWWPPAPGWYGVGVLLAALLIWAVIRVWKRWRANAYRRAALKELASASDSAGIAEVLRRTGLAIAPREIIATKAGPDWLDWLAARSPLAMPDAIRTQLSAGVYGRPADSSDMTGLREFAADWIKSHHV